ALASTGPPLRICPFITAGVVGPKPVANSWMISPGLAGVVEPGKRVVGPSRLASRCRAAMYLSKLNRMNAGGMDCLCRAGGAGRRAVRCVGAAAVRGRRPAGAGLQRQARGVMVIARLERVRVGRVAGRVQSDVPYVGRGRSPVHFESEAPRGVVSRRVAVL